MEPVAYLVKISVDSSIQNTLTVSLVHHHERFNLKINRQKYLHFCNTIDIGKIVPRLHSLVTVAEDWKGAFLSPTRGMCEQHLKT